MSELVVCVIVGARPQFVKAATLSRAIEAHNRSTGSPTVEQVLIHTGQHYDPAMSAVFFDELELPAPTHHLDVGSAPHGAQTGEMMKRLEPILDDLRPHVVVVVGDTNSTLAAALVAAKLHLPVAHVEAGLRSYNRRMPEEINRTVTDHVSDLLFCPSQRAAEILHGEGITAGVHVTGDVMLDALEYLRRSAADIGMPAHREIPAGEYALATVHRAENTDDPDRLRAIIGGLGDLASTLPIVLPLHPRTANALNGTTMPPGVHPTEPVGPKEMADLVAGARVGLTDSGGLQKELYWLGVPCVTLRDETEWVETVATGWNVVTGADRTRITAAALAHLDGRHGDRPPIYGTPGAAARMIGLLVDSYADIPEPVR